MKFRATVPILATLAFITIGLGLQGELINHWIVGLGVLLFAAAALVDLKTRNDNGQGPEAEG